MRHIQWLLASSFLLTTSAFAANPPAGNYTVLFTDKTKMGLESDPISARRKVIGSARVDASGNIFVVLASGELRVANELSPMRVAKVDVENVGRFSNNADNTNYAVSFSATGFTFLSQTDGFFDTDTAPPQFFERVITWKFTKTP